MESFRQKFDRELYYLSHKYYQKAVAIHPYTKNHPNFTSYSYIKSKAVAIHPYTKTHPNFTSYSYIKSIWLKLWNLTAIAGLK